MCGNNVFAIPESQQANLLFSIMCLNFPKMFCAIHFFKEFFRNNRIWIFLKELDASRGGLRLFITQSKKPFDYGLPAISRFVEGNDSVFQFKS